MCNSSSTDFYVYADFVPLSNTDCFVNVLALKVIWSLTAVTCGVSLLIKLHSSWRIISQHQKQFTSTTSTAPSGMASRHKVNDDGDGGTLMLTQQSSSSPPKAKPLIRLNKLKIGLMLCSIVSSSFFLMASIWKAYDKDRNVGVDFPIGILLLIGNLSWFAAAACMLKFFIELQISNAKIKHKEWRNRLHLFHYRIMPVLFSLSLCCGIAASMMYLDSSSLILSQICVGLTFGIMGLVLLGMQRALFYLILFPLQSDLISAIETNSNQVDAIVHKRNDEMKKLVSKIRLFTFIMQATSYTSLPVFFAFAFVPYLMLRVGYLIPFIVMIAVVECGNCCCF